MGEPLDDGVLSFELGGRALDAHVLGLGGGRYLVHAPLEDGATGALVVKARTTVGESVARVSLGDAPAAPLALMAQHAHVSGS
jgi:hypothetical protein